MDRTVTPPSLIELDLCSFSYRGNPVLQDLSLSIPKGSFLGVFGPNGGGKTTLLKLLMGFLEPQSGSVQIFGTKPKNQRHRIGYVPQAQRTDPDFPITVSELIALGQLSKRPFFGGFPSSDWEPCLFWMEKLGLLDHQNKTYGELSGGLAQRALLARALIANPDLLLLDEPTANIDSSSLSIVLQTLEQLRGSKTILFVTHDLKSVMNSASRFLLCAQRTVSFVEPSQICSHFSLGLYPSLQGASP